MRIDRRTSLSIRWAATTASLSLTTPIHGMSSRHKRCRGLARRKAVPYMAFRPTTTRLFFRHVIMSGKIFQVDDITGEAFRVPLFKGTWKKGEKYAYYDEVTHNGSSWICVNEKGTSTEPADGNADWLKYAAKGDKGDVGTGITNCGDWQTGKHIPYMGITKMAGRVFYVSLLMVPTILRCGLRRPMREDASCRRRTVERATDIPLPGT